ncbi:UPF0147 family protein [Candidatus Woesearchaeota archaeon]|nr:UPF0147 family protein [Candidatus Woesearchaeota archaeon]
MEQETQEVVALLEELQQDNTVPRNVKIKLQEMQQQLQSDNGELSLKINRILSEVEEIANDINLPMFIRTQIWNLTSMLESINT